MVSLKKSLLLLAAAATAFYSLESNAATATADATSRSVSTLASQTRPHVHPSVHRTLRAQGTVNVIVTLADSPESVIESVKEGEFASRGAKITSLVERLEAHAKQSQAALHELVSGGNGGSSASDRNDNSTTSEDVASTPPQLYRRKISFWITNQVYFEAATFELVEMLSTLPSVAQVREEEVLSLPKLAVSSESSAANVSVSSVPMSTTEEAFESQWGVAKIGAPEVWAKGYTGQGVVVGIIDSGVMATHPILKGNYRKDYNWFDGVSGRSTSFDDNGHGTHVAGTLVGSNGYGVAPGATWIACKACDGAGNCTESSLLSCGQFMLCPTQNGVKDCSKAPHIVNNSWGLKTQLSSFYDATVRSWVAAKIVPVFAIGNTGPVCNTASSPGDGSSVISVGSTTINDEVSDFSSKGPATRTKLVKPEVAAPGSNIKSTWNNGGFATASGTSMATPHVSGVIALMLNTRPGATLDQVKAALFSTTEKAALQPSRMACGGIRDGTFPNNVFGHGRVNALAAVNKITPVTDRCAGLSAVLCSELLCEWNASSGVCSSWA